MNKINDFPFYYIFNSLFTSSTHICQLNQLSKIEEINTNSEEMPLSIRLKSSEKIDIIFKGLYVIKGEFSNCQKLKIIFKLMKCN